MPLIYEFKEGGDVYTKYLSKLVSKRKWEFLESELMISSDTNSNYLEKYLVATSSRDSLTLLDSKGRKVKLVPLKSISAKNIPAANLNKELLKEYWQLSFKDSSQENKGEIEFYRNKKYLFTYDSGNSFNSSVFEWGVYNIDSLTIILIKDFKPNLIFIDSLSLEGIHGKLLREDGQQQHVLFERISPRANIKEEMLAGYWELTSSPKSSINIPVVMEYELEDGYMGYYMNTKDGGVLSMGSWGLSKSGNVIVLDELKEGNKSRLNILELSGDKLKLVYEGDELEFSRTQMPI